MSKVPPPPINLIPKPPERKYSRKELLDEMKGRTPPQALELEGVIIGAILIDKDAIDQVADILKPSYFFNRDNGTIFQAILQLQEKHIGIDVLTVSQELSRMGKLGEIGGDFALISLLQRVSSSAHIEYHARIIIQKYVLRRLIALSEETIDKSYFRDPDIFDLMEDMGNEISSISAYIIKAEGLKTVDAKKELYEKVQSVIAGEPPGVYSGIEEYDDWGGGFQKRELITFAARPGMGKTTAVLSIAGKAAFEKEIPVAFFTLEMAEADLKARLAAKGTNIPYDKIRLGKLSQEELSKVLAYYDFVDNSCLHIVEKMNRLESIIKKLRELVEKYGIKMAMIDYVQLMKLSKSNGDRTSDLSTITRDLKALANELNIPIIIIAQLSRGVDTRPGHRPVLADLKQSGSIEEDSDTVIFILREAYYSQSEGQMLPPHIIGKTLMIVAKGRNTGTRDFWTLLDFINYDFRTFSSG